MTKIIAIGNCGNNILEFLQKQNYHIKRDENYKFISVGNSDDIQQLQLNEDDTIFVVSGLGGSQGGKLTIELTQTLLEKNFKVKNIVILPFHAETNAKKAILELESLIAINQNVEVYPNNDFMEDESNTMLEIMGLADKVIFDRINREDENKDISTIQDVQSIAQNILRKYKEKVN